VARFECQQWTHRVSLGALDPTVREPPKTHEHSSLQRRQVPRRDWHTKIERVDGQACRKIRCIGRVEGPGRAAAQGQTLPTGWHQQHVAERWLVMDNKARKRRPRLLAHPGITQEYAA
jgi:hypothetical protein